jgi:hypothetical protein
MKKSIDKLFGVVYNIIIETKEGEKSKKQITRLKATTTGPFPSRGVNTRKAMKEAQAVKLRNPETPRESQGERQQLGAEKKGTG